MSINANDLSRLRFFSTETATVFVVEYPNGATEAFTVPTDEIVFEETFDVKDFCKELEDVAKEKKKAKDKKDKGKG